MIEKLRERTRYLHEKLENSGLMSPIFTGELTRAEYIHILKVFYGYFQAVHNEVNKFPVQTVIRDLEERRTPALLLEDLKELGEGSIPPLAPPPGINNLAEAMGSLYVLEGSTLGGGVISKKLKGYDFLKPEKGIKFFSGYGKETGKKWKIFVQNLENFSNSNEKEEGIIKGANNTFLSFYNWISEEK